MPVAAAALCLALLGNPPVRVEVDRFTLSWTHSIEKVEWQEDWAVGPEGLRVLEARVKGSGVGMEPAEGAVLRDGWWAYVPQLPPQRQVMLATSGFTADHTLCAAGKCEPLAKWVRRPAGDESPVEMAACAP
ncbi:DUF1850 domain-containing protein [Aerophototrophica crusticola]|uniref:DUF1850 domain-containing protein n=1 Tax=Aerophototrophica crusticola TaxID=1709002 RepID=A0A858R6A6_9PROT|nr:DUF1850 domain-containing protein [Rhodospirillaceae bacterium B3]